MMIVKTKKVTLKILSIDFTDGLVIQAELEEPVAEQTSMFPNEKEEEPAKTPAPLTDAQIQSLVKHGHYSIEEVLDMPRTVALVRLGNLVGAYKARQEGRAFIPVNRFPIGQEEYQDTWLTKDDPISYDVRQSPRKRFEFTQPTETSPQLLSIVDIPQKRKRGRPRKLPANMLQ